MLEILKKRNVYLKWLTNKPEHNVKYSLLVPQYNELSKCRIDERLDYYQCLSNSNPYINIIIIDDGSTDGSLSIIQDYINRRHRDFFVASVYPNSQKVGALYLATREINCEFVIVSDFDTDIHGLENLDISLRPHISNPNFLGGYFRMLPFESAGNIFLFQQLEYSLLRSLYKMHKKDLSVPVMPGAGSIYRREILISIYNNHSGLRNGEDREAALLGQKEGKQAVYLKDICTMTRPPQNFKNLLQQRIRWNLGYIETFNKEKLYYYTQLKKKSAMGVRFAMDVFVVLFLLVFPLLLIFLSLLSLRYCLYLLIAIYWTYLLFSIILMTIVPNESYEFKNKKLQSVLVYPVIKFLIEYFAWMGAIKKFIITSGQNKGSI